MSRDSANKNGRSSSIGKLCHFSNGHGFTPRDWASNGLPIIRIQNLNGSRQFNYYRGMPDSEWIVEPGQLLFAWAGVRGVSFGPTIWDGPRGVLNQHIYQIEPHPDIDKTWLHAALQVVTHRIERKAHGFKSSLVHVKKADITNQRVFVPSLEEQKRIGKFLSCSDRSIDLAEGLIAAKQELRAWLMQQLVTGKRRLPGFTKLWRSVQLGEFMAESRLPGSNGKIAKKITVKLYGLGVLEKSDKREGSTNTNYYVRKSGQFIYSKLDFLNGAFGLVPPELDGFESTLDLPCFDIGDGLNAEFLLYLVGREAFYSRFLSSAMGGRKARRVAPSEFLTIQVRLPSVHEQAAIVSAIKSADRECQLLTYWLDAHRDQKKGLMQQLLTGKRRVKVSSTPALDARARAK